ncbi:sulfate adenylyltransferase subunit CysN [Magnetospirillum sp. 15-1]|uniref:sulfate adenylyltransferase subunit CysN n=1 Tax=Magnetospirillum sp. 15-1 TaxID=1979370 RepID=UPI000BBCD925|nr:sulfate adenylyltransferase subunit CysN [Magnetospirillum sp. 15-1]
MGGHPQSLDAVLDAHAAKDILRLLTCGSVDDGKSTLIGRMLYDTGSVATDQMAALERDSRRSMPEGGLDFSLLVDGLEAEREQGITIDVAYRYFGTERRKFIVADTPGHEQYTRNMATGASNADLAVVLVDARQGVVTQTRRHATIVHLMGITDVVLAVNKMDLVGYDQAVFARIEAEFKAFATAIGIAHVTAIPVSALKGDNLAVPSDSMAWYTGQTLLHFMETVRVERHPQGAGLRMPVQWVCRPNQDFRGYAGTIASGRVAPGMAVTIEPGGRASRVESIVTHDGVLTGAGAGQAVILTLTDDVDVSRGDVIAAADDRPASSDQFAAHLVWMSERPLLPERSYLMRIGNQTAGFQVSHIKYRLNVNTLEHTAATRLDLNDVAVCNIALDRQVVFEPYGVDRSLGGFILMDRVTNETVGCGMIDFALRRAANIHWQAVTVDKAARAALKGQRPAVVWLTGLSGAGKSSIADLVERKLTALGRHTYLLDGDNVRHGLNRDLGFTDADRVENIRRVAEVARLFVDAGMIVLTSFISPFRLERRMARDLVGADAFIEVFADAPLAVCEGRDPKGLYRKARAGEIQNFTGIDSAYEAPEQPDLHLHTDTQSLEEMADRVIALLRERSLI